MAFDKPFLDLDKQLNLLESRKLIITNRDRAKRLIMTSSYYDLINLKLQYEIEHSVNP